MKPVTRQKVNITIDIIMFLVMVALAVIGFIIRYVLIPGSERWEKYGRNVDLTCWGLDRHEWGFIHLILGIFIVILLVLHIIFHWAMIVCYLKRLLPKTVWRYTVVGGMIVLSCIFIAAPFYLSPEAGAPIRGQGEGYWPVNSGYAVPTGTANPGKDYPSEQAETVMPVQEAPVNATEEKEPHEKEARVFDIKGFDTIGELAVLHGISADDLKKGLNIPHGISNNEQLGRIRRIYGFTMREVEDCILALQDQSK